MYTLENDRCDCIRKDSGDWGFFRSGGKAEFESYAEAKAAYMEMERQGKHTNNVSITRW